MTRIATKRQFHTTKSVIKLQCDAYHFSDRPMWEAERCNLPICRQFPITLRRLNPPGQNTPSFLQELLWKPQGGSCHHCKWTTSRLPCNRFQTRLVFQAMCVPIKAHYNAAVISSPPPGMRMCEFDAQKWAFQRFYYYFSWSLAKRTS